MYDTYDNVVNLFNICFLVLRERLYCSQAVAH